MDLLRTLTGRRVPSASSAGLAHEEEMLAEVDEEPDEKQHVAPLLSFNARSAYSKAAPLGPQRRESLLTRQLHSETEHSEEDVRMPPPLRALSTQSTWSNQSTTSTAELTSDDGRSMPSPATSPPLPATMRPAFHTLDKPSGRQVKIIGQEDAPAGLNMKDTGSEKAIEADLGRRRCISFACGGKNKPKPASPPPISPADRPVATSPPKRKCMLKFVCPSRSETRQDKPAESSRAKPSSSPSPLRSKTSHTDQPIPPKLHRGSDSTVTHPSPKSIRKSLPDCTSTSRSGSPLMERKEFGRKQSIDSNASGTEALRFHEFASSDDEPEDWVRETTVHRNRLTLNDTLRKEHALRKACEEAEQEVVEEEEQEEAEAEADEDVALAVDIDENEDDEEEEDGDEDEESGHSDAGFHSDDEEGFAASDSEDGDDSDNEWWRPGGRSTAATSVEHLDRPVMRSKPDAELVSSLGSVSSGNMPHRSWKRRLHQGRRRHQHTPSLPIRRQTDVPDLPDSTDFVCGTLDEDRPLEQAYLTCIKDKEAAKHKARPQDIDPTFPTSDPEMDEEDDEDLEDPEESEEEDLVHGELEELDGESTLRRHRSPRLGQKGQASRSPAPRARHHSPAPTARRALHHTPPPIRRVSTRSPAPPTTRIPARSPAPRKLFGNSPKRTRSPPPTNRTTSPPNTRRASPHGGALNISTDIFALGQRPQLTHTASLPRNGGFLLSRMTTMRADSYADSDTAGANKTDIPKRGAIDIVKGLEKKRQRRKEKLYQKLCAKAAAKGEKAYKVKPGKGAERMREVGLELQRYHGKGEHILSI